MKTPPKPHGYFVISLDFELHWGLFDHTPVEDKITYFENTLKVIPQILALFEQYGIHATWASIGMIYHKNREEWLHYVPAQLPAYRNPKLSAYQYVLDNPYRINTFAPFYFAHHLLQQIRETPGQEVGSHTYSNFYCLEPGQTEADFRTDLEIQRTKANIYHIDPQSLVLPRNQYNAAYNKVCAEVGIKTIRTNPEVWFWNTANRQTLLHKIMRTADCYLPLSETLVDINSLQKAPDEPLLLPASRFLKPHSPFGILNYLRLRRVLNEMQAAAQQHKIYHLWWHPHNFGSYPKQALAELETILKHYRHLQQQYGFMSAHMKNMYEHTQNP